MTTTATAKAKHLKSFDWSSMLARHHAACVRSAMRGMGPRQQCEEIFLGVFVSGAGKTCGRRSGSFGLARTGVVAYFFMIRAIVLSTMLYYNFDLDPGAKMISILLPATKTDPLGPSCSRSWGCVCPDEAPDARSCPYHAADLQKTELMATFGDAVNNEGSGVSPTFQGKTTTRDKMGASIQKVAVEESLDTHTKAGKKFTGQMFRVVGSRHMMRHGVQVPPIMSMAGWVTHRVSRCLLKDSPIVNITKEHHAGGQAIQVGAIGEETKAVNKFGQATLKQLEELRLQVEKQDKELAKLGEQHAILDSSTLPRFEVSDEYQKWHVALRY